MSIQEVEISTIVNSSGSGIDRKIHSGALGLVLDTIQITQYVKPEESTVRELTANAVDSQSEKEKAINIITGNKKVEDYYIKRDGEKYDDSNWDPSYYDLKWLNKNNNNVELEYIESKELGWSDRFIVTDHGVGLGMPRLEGYFQIGYSTKRNSVDALGAFGFGNKASLSLRNDYYTLVTAHNGKLFRFNCYSYKIDSLVGKFNLRTGKENNFVIFNALDEDPTKHIKVYYEETEELNFTQIAVPLKRHHRTRITAAIKSQLLYFENVQYVYRHEDGEVEYVDFKANVIYDSENIIVSDNNQFSKPHVIIVKDNKVGSKVGVSYGYVQFEELEMEELNGNVGIKCPIRSVIRDDNTGKEIVLQEGVSVTPSRESVIWDEHTRNFIKRQFEAVVSEVGDLVSKELKEPDFLSWISKCGSLFANQSNTMRYGARAQESLSSNVLYRLKDVIDVHSLKPRYSVDPQIRYSSNIDSIFWGFAVRNVSILTTYKRGKAINTINRLDISTTPTTLSASNCYFQVDGAANGIRDRYLISTRGSDSIFLLKLVDVDKLKTDYEENEKRQATLFGVSSFDELIERRNKVLEYLKASSGFTIYDDIEVPEEWKKQANLKDSGDDSEDEIAEDNGSTYIEPRKTPEELRAEQQRMVCHTFIRDMYRKDDKMYTFQKWEPKIAEVYDEYNHNLIYGDDSDLELLSFVGNIFYEQFSYRYTRANALSNGKLTLVKCAAANKKYFKHCLHVEHALRDEEYIIVNGEVKVKKTMSELFVKWYTARLIDNQLKNFAFMVNYKTIDSEVARIYSELVAYRDQYYSNIDNQFLYEEGRLGQRKSLFDSMLEYCNKCMEMQLFVEEHKDDAEAVKQKSIELFGDENIIGAIGVEMGVYNKLQALIDYAEPVKDLFNYLNVLISNTHITRETECLIREVIQMKQPMLILQQPMEQQETEVVVQQTE